MKQQYLKKATPSAASQVCFPSLLSSSPWSAAMAPLLRFQTVERGLAHAVVERRSPQAGISPFWLADVEVLSRSAEVPVALEGRDASGSTGQATTMNMAPSIKTFIGLMVFVAIFVIGESHCKLHANIDLTCCQASPS